MFIKCQTNAIGCVRLYLDDAAANLWVKMAATPEVMSKRI